MAFALNFPGQSVIALDLGPKGAGFDYQPGQSDIWGSLRRFYMLPIFHLRRFPQAFVCTVIIALNLGFDGTVFDSQSNRLFVFDSQPGRNVSNSFQLHNVYSARFGIRRCRD